MICDHIAANLSIEKDGFELAPFNREGGEPTLFMTVRGEIAESGENGARSCEEGRQTRSSLLAA
jgi:hypothetical protein